jgi:hypothetical protein
MVEGYCMKCKAKRDMKSTEEVTMKNKRKAMKGECTKCGTKMFKILAGPAKSKKGGAVKSKKSKKGGAVKSKKTKKSKKSKKSVRK